MVEETVKKTTRSKKTEVSSENSINVYGMDGTVEKTIAMPKELTGEAHPALIEQYIRVYLTNQRQGNASVKTRSEVIGSTKKIFKQKGTGRARHGSIKSPTFVGGGVAFGPKPKDHTLSMNKKQKRKALFGSLAMQMKEGNVIAFADSFMNIEAKTKKMSEILKKMELNGKKILIMTPSNLETDNLILAARNIENVTLKPVTTINPYIILHADKVVFVESAVDGFNKQFVEQHEN